MLGNESVPFRTICSMTGLHSIFEIQPKISKNYIYHPNQFPHMIGNTVHGITILSGLRKHQFFLVARVSNNIMVFVLLGLEDLCH